MVAAVFAVFAVGIGVVSAVVSHVVLDSLVVVVQVLRTQYMDVRDLGDLKRVWVSTKLDQVIDRQ